MLSFVFRFGFHDAFFGAVNDTFLRVFGFFGLLHFRLPPSESRLRRRRALLSFGERFFGCLELRACRLEPGESVGLRGGCGEDCGAAGCAGGVTVVVPRVPDLLCPFEGLTWYHVSLRSCLAHFVLRDTSRSLPELLLQV